MYLTMPTYKKREIAFWFLHNAKKIVIFFWKYVRVEKSCKSKFSVENGL